MKDLQWDFRFLNIDKKKEALAKIIMAITTDDLKLIMQCADRLKIENYCTIPSVDLLWEIASRLSILEAEITSPLLIMDRIRQYMKAN